LTLVGRTPLKTNQTRIIIKKFKAYQRKKVLSFILKFPRIWKNKALGAIKNSPRIKIEIPHKLRPAEITDEYLISEDKVEFIAKLDDDLDSLDEQLDFFEERGVSIYHQISDYTLSDMMMIQHKCGKLTERLDKILAEKICTKDFLLEPETV